MNRTTAAVAGLLAATVIGAGVTASQANGAPAAHDRGTYLTVTGLRDGSGIAKVGGTAIARHPSKLDPNMHPLRQPGWRIGFGSQWHQAPARMVGRHVDLVGGGAKRVTRHALVNVGPTTYVIWPHSDRVGTS